MHNVYHISLYHVKSCQQQLAQCKHFDIPVIVVVVNQVMHGRDNEKSTCR